MQYLVSLGSNLGDRQANLQRAIRRLEGSCGRLRLKSPVYDTPPWGFSAGTTFYNQVLLIDSDLAPQVFMTKVLKIENRMGRQRSRNDGYVSRVIDIDLLLVENEIIISDDLKIPHPLFHERAFVLAPAKDIVPDWVHPVLGKTISELCENCLESAGIVRLS